MESGSADGTTPAGSDPVWIWRKPDADALASARRQLSIVENVPTCMRDGVLLYGDLFLPGKVDRRLVERYASLAFRLQAKVAQSGHVESSAPVTEQPAPKSVPAVDEVWAAQERQAIASAFASSDELYPCVLIRTPYDKSRVNPDMRHPALFWAQHGYVCFIQDCRGRFKSKGTFYKYCNEAKDGYDTVEWLATQPWSNGCICTCGVSYLAHVQTSMACLDPPHLTASYVLKGGFFDAFTSGIRQGGAFEARQWVWAMKHAPAVSDGGPVGPPGATGGSDGLATSIKRWLRKYPYRRGQGPLRLVPPFSRYMYDFCADKAMYSDAFWGRPGLDVRSSLDNYSQAPTIFMSGWYDIYARSAVEFFRALHPIRPKGHIKLVMGPWIHSGAEGHIAGDLNFGSDAAMASNVGGASRWSLAKDWFNEMVDMTKKSKAASDQAQSADEAGTEEEKDEEEEGSMEPDLSLLGRLAKLPKGRRAMPSAALPAVLYFRMGGGEGHLTVNGHLHAGGVWLGATTFPPSNVVPVIYALGRRALLRQLQPSRGRVRVARAAKCAEAQLPKFRRERAAGAQRVSLVPGLGPELKTRTNPAEPLSPVAESLAQPKENVAVPVKVAQQAESVPVEVAQVESVPVGEAKVDNGSPIVGKLARRSRPAEYVEYDFDPANPVPTIGGNVLPYPGVLFSGAFDQVERKDHFMCTEPGMPLSSRRDVLVWQTPFLTADVDITGSPRVVLYVSSSCPDTDFTAMLVDVYPPSEDYPFGNSINVTHGIRRCSLRVDDHQVTPCDPMTPDKMYRITITMYPTSALIVKGHRIAIYVSSSNFPHFDVNPNTGESTNGAPSSRLVVARNRVWLSSSAPSYVELPTIPAMQSPGNVPLFSIVRRAPIADSVVDDYSSSDEEDDPTVE